MPICRQSRFLWSCFCPNFLTTTHSDGGIDFRWNPIYQNVVSSPVSSLWIAIDPSHLGSSKAGVLYPVGGRPRIPSRLFLLLSYLSYVLFAHVDLSDCRCRVYPLYLIVVLITPDFYHLNSYLPFPRAA